MNKLQEKSPCCRDKIIRFGNRRRQCHLCRRTWRVWKKKKGRKKRRVDQKLLFDYLDGKLVSIRAEAIKHGIPPHTLRYRVQKARDSFLTKTPWPKVPKAKSLILLADAIVKRIGGRWYTIHSMAIRDIRKNKATLLPPIVLPKKENVRDWYAVLRGIPEKVAKNIKFTVSDGHRGIVWYAKHQGWKMQRCQAHIVFAVQGRRSRSRWSNHREEGEKIYQLLKIILQTKETVVLKKAIDEIEEMGWLTKSNQLGSIIGGFLKDVDDYRTCLEYPKSNLPHTNNSLESFHSQLQELCHKARGFSSVDSLEKWISAFIKYKKEITCNGFHQPSSPH